MKEGIISNYLEAMTKLGLNEKQQHAMEWKLKISQPVEMFPIKVALSVIGGIDVEKYMRRMGLVMKGCYPNSAKMVYHLFKHLPWNIKIRYVEGMCTVSGIPIEHAWNKLIILNPDGSTQKEMHFDVTMEYVNGYDFHDSIAEEEYVSFITFGYDDVVKYMFSSECYGPWLQNYYDEYEKI